MPSRLTGSMGATHVYGVIVAGMLSLCAAFYFLGIAPLTAQQRDIHLDGVARTFDASLEMLNAQIAGFQVTARQVGSRSALREAQARLASGEISRNDLTTFATPKLLDALDASPALVGISRRGIDRTPLVVVGYGVDPADAASCPRSLSPGTIDAELRVIAGHAFMQLCNTLTDKTGKPIGYDQLLFGMATMARHTVRRSGLTVRYRLAAAGSDRISRTDGIAPLPFPAKARGYGRIEQLDEAAETFVIAGLTAAEGLWLRADIDLAALHAQLDADHSRLYAVVALAALATGVLTVLVVNPLLRAAMGAEAAEQKAEARADFLRTMSHELRTPINGVLGMADVLAHQGLDERQRRSLAIIRQSGLELLAMVTAVLNATKIASGAVHLRKANFDIAEMGRTVAAQHEADAARRGLILETELDGPMLHRIGDSDQVAQIVGSLLANAIKFSDRGTVCLEIDTGLPDRVRLSVSDEGIGMSDDEAATIFEPFVQADVSTTRRHGGAGLGLTIVRGLVDAMGGRIDVQTAPGKGTRFTVTLPLPAVIEGRGGLRAHGTAARTGPGAVAQIVAR